MNNGGGNTFRVESVSYEFMRQVAVVRDSVVANATTNEELRMKNDSSFGRSKGFLDCVQNDIWRLWRAEM